MSVAVTERQRLQAEAWQSLADADWDAPHGPEPTDGESTPRVGAKGLTMHPGKDVEALLPVGAITNRYDCGSIIGLRISAA